MVYFDKCIICYFAVRHNKRKGEKVSCDNDCGFCQTRIFFLTIITFHVQI